MKFSFDFFFMSVMVLSLINVYAIGVPFCFLMKMFNFPGALVEKITSTMGKSLDTLVKGYVIRRYGFI